MKILGQLPPLAAPLAVAFSLVLSTGTLRAFGPGGTGNGGSVNGVGTTGNVSTGASVAGGARGGGVMTSNAGRSTAAPAMTGARPNVSFSNNVPRISTGTFTRSTAARPNVPAAYAPGTRSASPTGTGAQPASRTPARPANAWSGTAVASTENEAARNDSSRQLPRSNGYTNNRFTGQRLDPGAYGANLPANRWSSGGEHRNGRSHFPYRAYNPYGYGPVYAPYVGYYGGYYGAYPYYGDGLSSDVANGFDNGTPTVTPQYTDQGQDANAGQQNPAPQPATRDRGADANAQPTVPNNGPDSLVEAVQEELIRRGYFAGKVDAMYSPDTKEALRKFQQDHHLADSGLINEATLHALQLD